MENKFMLLHLNLLMLMLKNGLELRLGLLIPQTWVGGKQLLQFP